MRFFACNASSPAASQEFCISPRGGKAVFYFGKCE
jgi:hypothetical protein